MTCLIFFAPDGISIVVCFLQLHAIVEWISCVCGLISIYGYACWVSSYKKNSCIIGWCIFPIFHKGCKYFYPCLNLLMDSQPPPPTLGVVKFLSLHSDWQTWYVDCTWPGLPGRGEHGRRWGWRTVGRRSSDRHQVESDQVGDAGWAENQQDTCPQGRGGSRLQTLPATSLPTLSLASTNFYPKGE